MASITPPDSELAHAVEQVSRLLGTEVGPTAPQRSPNPEEQKQAIKFKEAISTIWAKRSFRPFLVSGALGPLCLYALWKFPDARSWGPIEIPGIGLGGTVLFASFASSLCIGGSIRLLGLVCNAPWLQHYWSLLEVWSKYRLGRMPPEQYYKYGAVLDYRRLYGHVPQDARPETQAEFVSRVVRWRMSSIRIRKRVGRKPGGPGSGTSRTSVRPARWPAPLPWESSDE